MYTCICMCMYMELGRKRYSRSLLKLGRGLGLASIWKRQAVGLRNEVQKHQTAKSVTPAAIASLFVYLSCVPSAACGLRTMRVSKFALVLKLEVETNAGLRQTLFSRIRSLESLVPKRAGRFTAGYLTTFIPVQRCCQQI